MAITLNLIFVFILIGLTAFFVSSEFAIVKVRMSRVEQLIAEGNKRAVAVKKIVKDIDYYLSACTLGISVSTLALGSIGDPTVERMLRPFLDETSLSSSTISVTTYVLALAITTFLHVVIGELVPKSLTVKYTDVIALTFSKPLYLFGRLFFPVIWFMKKMAQLIIRLFGVESGKEEEAPTEEELQVIINQSYQNGFISQTELSYLNNIFSFNHRNVKDIMKPRKLVTTIMADTEIKEVVRIIEETSQLRYPITEGEDKDEIIGFINSQELTTKYALGKIDSLQDVMKELSVIHESEPLLDVLLKMQRENIREGLVIDEFGGTAGILSIEDILEEMVGDIKGELDDREVPSFKRVETGNYHINGRVLLSDLEERFSIKFDDEYDVDTIGGWMQVQQLNSKEETIEKDGHIFKTIEQEGHQVIQVEMIVPQEEHEPELADKGN